MNFLDKLEMLMAQKNLNRATLAAKSGVPYTTIDSLWKRGYENIKLSTLRKLAAALNVTLDYLADDEMPARAQKDTGEEMICRTADEAALLTAYRSLNKASQSVALAMLQGLAGNPDAQKGPLPGATGTSYI